MISVASKLIAKPDKVQLFGVMYGKPASQTLVISRADGQPIQSLPTCRDLPKGMSYTVADSTKVNGAVEVTFTAGNESALGERAYWLTVEVDGLSLALRLHVEYRIQEAPYRPPRDPEL